jgi:hypothetical protein
MKEEREVKKKIAKVFWMLAVLLIGVFMVRLVWLWSGSEMLTEKESFVAPSFAKGVEDFPIICGATRFIYTTVSFGQGAEGVFVGYRVQLRKDDVVEFYRKEMAKDGWKLILEEESEEKPVYKLMVFKKEADYLGVVLRMEPAATLLEEVAGFSPSPREMERIFKLLERAFSKVVVEK